MYSKPKGVETFLFTKIENSSQLAREHPETWEATQGRHDAFLREAIELHYRFVIQTAGDGSCADPSLGMADPIPYQASLL